jgi:alkaline phosphatase
MIEEQIDFNKSIDATVAWVEKNSSWDETLLIVTGDHETGYLTGPDSETEQGGDQVPIKNPIKNMGKQHLPEMEWQSGSHTNSLIPFFAKGFGSDKFASMADEIDPVRGNYLDNTEIAKVIFELLEFAHTKKVE